MQKPLLLISGVVVIVAGLGGYAWIRRTLSYVPPSLTEMRAPIADVHGVGLAQFQQLNTGMSYDEAVAILGSKGIEQSRSEFGDHISIMYTWPGIGSRGANMNAMFQNDRLVSKAQYGLQ